MLGRITSMMGEMNQKPDNRCSLLAALKPWLRPERQARADEAIRILKLLRIWELYQKGGS